jgi:hypothetical protein
VLASASVQGTVGEGGAGSVGRRPVTPWSATPTARQHMTELRGAKATELWAASYGS